MKCKGENCEQLIYWVNTKNGKKMPLNYDGEPHWATCPDGASFNRDAQKKPAQSELFEEFHD